MLAKLFFIWVIGGTIAAIMDCQEQEVGTWDEVAFSVLKGYLTHWFLVIYYCIVWK